MPTFDFIKEMMDPYIPWINWFLENYFWQVGSPILFTNYVLAPVLGFIGMVLLLVFASPAFVTGAVINVPTLLLLGGWTYLLYEYGFDAIL